MLSPPHHTFCCCVHLDSKVSTNQHLAFTWCHHCMLKDRCMHLQGLYVLNFSSLCIDGEVRNRHHHINQSQHWFCLPLLSVLDEIWKPSSEIQLNMIHHIILQQHNQAARLLSNHITMVFYKANGFKREEGTSTFITVNHLILKASTYDAKLYKIKLPPQTWSLKCSLTFHDAIPCQTAGGAALRLQTSHKIQSKDTESVYGCITVTLYLCSQYSAVQFTGALLISQLELQSSQSSWGDTERKQTISITHIKTWFTNIASVHRKNDIVQSLSG